MSKILKSYTIIPPELYVQRDADRQIKNIINDMGRPGYVLVSRQMGKTNLLINAKRQLETYDDVFVYIDLSNPFENARACFENIIDTAIETNVEKFRVVSRTIIERRKELSETPPHKQHTNELRMLLKGIKGKFVIILDEIDALTKTQYSDQVFAQIRSIYFSRVNFPELGRLTYILSGVIEPNEIIKDPKISPFNIGQKIFLNDFNRIEFEKFLVNSQLVLSSDVTDRIFYWTNGNPRITWDVCSEVENRIRENELSASKIDDIISEIYLQTFDKPPIDNIRDLVRKDKEIRTSILQIMDNNLTEVSDKIKNKLYLSGIVNYEENNIHIKNEIIKRSLSVDWINSVEEEEKGLVKIGIELFEKENYKDALSVFERFLSDNNFEESENSLCLYYMGYAAYRTKDFGKAINYLEKTNFDVNEDPKWFFRALNLRGLIYYYLGRVDESLKCLKQVMDGERNDETYVRALINFSSIALNSNKYNYIDEAMVIFNGIISETGFKKEKISQAFIDELKSIAHYNLAQYQVFNNDLVNAIINYKYALQLAIINTKPSIILALYEITVAKEGKYELLDQLVKLIIEQNLRPIEKNLEKPLDFSIDDFKNIVINCYTNFNDSLFEEIKPYLSILGEKSFSKHLYEFAVYAIANNKEWGLFSKFLYEIYLNLGNLEYNVDEETRYNTLKLLSYFNNPSDSVNTSIEYLALFSRKLFIVDYLDFGIVANLIHYLTEQSEYDQALKYINLINSVRSTVPESIISNYLIIYHFQINVYLKLKLWRQAHKVAQEIVDLANDEKIKEQKSVLLGDTGLEVIKKNAESILNPIKNQTIVSSVNKIGRNQIIKVRYKDGTTIEAKYKKVESALNKGECFILN